VKKPGSLRTISVILALVVLLPALFYSMVEVNALSTSEELVADIYRRQLDVVLFSINQYAWDVVNGWASSLAALAEETAGTHAPRTELFEPLLRRHAAIDGVFLADSTGRIAALVLRDPATVRAETGLLSARLEAAQATIARLVEFSRQGYRKIEPVELDASSAGVERIVLLFVARDRDGLPLLLGIRLSDARFVNEVMAPRIAEAAATEFTLGVIRKSTGTRIFATDADTTGELKQQRQLWLFPDLVAGIRLRGATIEEIARSRFQRNLFLILLLDAVLIAGAWFVYRSVKKEMDFVRMKSDFVSNVSHELRTPLALIRMYAETLDMGRAASDLKKREYYATILRETERLTRLVNNLLNFSRMEAGRKPYVLKRTDLNAVVRDVMATFNDHLVREGFEPHVALGQGEVPVNADAEALQEALINVIDNAVKYSRENRFLRVTTGRTGTSAFVEIEDHGVGIAPEHRAKIFETFYRVSDGLVHTAKGSGLGLAIARHIMEAHHGRIDVVSTPGAGSTFRLIFPDDGQNPHH
jgi:two-component system phosphate regulon sensor histidine kinase PhoR